MPGLTREIATAIVETVKRDALCRQRIMSLHSGVVLAGQVRTAAMIMQNVSDAVHSNPLNIMNYIPQNIDGTPRDVYTCTGIADATCKAINNAIRYRTSTVLVNHVASAVPCSCEAFSHAGTGIVLKGSKALNAGRAYSSDNADCVFDWWNNLDIANPFIFRTMGDFNRYYLQWSTYSEFMGRAGKLPHAPNRILM